MMQMKREDINLLALHTVLTALYGPEAPATVSNAYQIALSAVDAAYTVGYDDAYDDADPQGVYFDGWNAGHSVGYTEGVEDQAYEPVSSCEPISIFGLTNDRGQAYDCTLGRYFRQWLLEEFYDMNLSEVDALTIEFMDSYWARPDDEADGCSFTYEDRYNCRLARHFADWLSEEGLCPPEEIEGRTMSFMNGYWAA